MGLVLLRQGKERIEPDNRKMGSRVTPSAQPLGVVLGHLQGRNPLQVPSSSPLLGT